MLTGRVEPVEFPLPEPGKVRVEFSWKLFLNGKLVGRSADYFPSEDAAQIALDEALAAMPSANVIGPGGCRTCAGWKPSPVNAPTLTCKDCGRVV